MAVVESLFCLPVANGRVENYRRTCLKEDILSHLLRINAEGPSLGEWDTSHAVKLWWSDKLRRVNRRDSHAQPINVKSLTVKVRHSYLMTGKSDLT